MPSQRTEAEARAGVVRGWGCTPTGEAPPAVVPTADDTGTTCVPAVMKRRWRRTLLYCIIVFLMVLVFLNIGLTLWIISALKLSMNGIGPIRIVRDGISVEGQAWILDTLVTSSIFSKIAQPITIRSYRNFTILVSEPNYVERAKLLLKRDLFQCSGKAFEVRDLNGGRVFRASREEVSVLADALTVNGPGGVTVGGAVQAPVLQAPPGSDLQLESSTRRLELMAPKSISLESRAGGIDVVSHADIKLDSVVGALKIDAPNIIFTNLKEASRADISQRSRKVKVYQLCACSSGKIFLASADGDCVAYEEDVDLCR